MSDTDDSELGAPHPGESNREGNDSTARLSHESGESRTVASSDPRSPPVRALAPVAAPATPLPPCAGHDRSGGGTGCA